MYEWTQRLGLPVERRAISVDGVTLNALLAGPESGELVILLHGFPEFSFGFRHQIPALASAGYRVLVPDQRGYAASDKPKGIRNYRLDRLAADVVELIDSQGRSRAALVGHDFGGAVAWWVAAHFPARVTRLCVINGPHPEGLMQTWRQSFRQLSKSSYILWFQVPRLPEWLWLRNDCRAGTEALLRSSTEGTFSPDELATYRRAWQEPEALRAQLDWYRNLLVSPPLRSAPQIAAPTCILWGLLDAFVGIEVAEASASRASNARIVRIAEGTHWLQHQLPDLVNSTLIEFLRERADAD